MNEGTNYYLRFGDGLYVTDLLRLASGEARSMPRCSKKFKGHGVALVVAAWGNEAAALNEITKELKL
jgi:hypothetical protein